MRYLLLFVFFGWFQSGLFAQADAPLAEADEMPYFPGCAAYEEDLTKKRRCSNQQLVNFVAEHLMYPEDARLEQLEGTVYARFVVDTTGAVGDASIIRDIGGGCGLEALRVIAMLPRFEPAVQDGRKVAVELRLPVQFRIEEATMRQDAQYTLSWGGLRRDTLYAHELIELLEQPVYVRDALGEIKPLTELAFGYTNAKGKTRGAQSRGRITPDLRKVVLKIRRGGVFTVYAAVQDQGEFYYLERPVVVR